MTTGPTIASLVPAATDLVAALDLADRLVGVSHECDHPEAEGLPVLTSATIAAAGLDTSVDPAQVDAAVSAAMASGAALYHTNFELLSQLAPDIIVGQAICDVCAVSSSSLHGRLPRDARLITLNATSLDGLWLDIENLSDALECPERGRALVSSLQRRIGAAARTPTSDAPSVVTLEWGDPPFIGGHWVPELVQLAGGRHLLGSPGEPSRRCSWEEVREAEPDVIVFMPCGYVLDVALEEAQRIFEPTPDTRIVVADAGRLFSRCTPAVAEAVEALAAVFAGAELPPGFVELD